MKPETFGVIIAIIVLGPFSPRGPAHAQGAKRDLDGCIRQYVTKYICLHETADIVARGIAAACAPAPTSLIGSVKDDHGAQVSYDLQKSIHETAYNRALIAVLDGRTSIASCSK